MLLILMYHQIAQPNDTTSLEKFYHHLSYLSDHFPIVLPGEEIKKNQLSICITFDDAYYDFYHYVYPKLCSLKVKAALGIPTNYIVESTTTSVNNRLKVEYPAGLSKSTLPDSSSPLCTWQEIQEMVQSGLVMPCSHSHTHVNLKTCSLMQLELETNYSQQILSKKLNTKITTFIYPFGAMHANAHKIVRKYYSFGLRIGGAINHSWEQRHGLLYRVNADSFIATNSKITSRQMFNWQLKYWFNQLRSK